MLYVHKDASIPIDVERLLLTLLNHTTRIEDDDQTDWDQLSNHLKSLSDCIRVIDMPLPIGILDGYLSLLNRVLGIVSRCLECQPGDVGEDGYAEGEDEEREAWEWNALLLRVEEGLGLVIMLERTKGDVGRVEGMERRWSDVTEGLKALKAILAKRT